MPGTGSEVQLGVTFICTTERQNCCGSNGLPLTPNSVRSLGRSVYVKSLCHPNLAEYVEIIRGKHECLIVASEYHGMNLYKMLKSGRFDPVRDNTENILKLAFDILNGLVYLNQLGLICRNLSLETILLDESMTAKIFNFGLDYITDGGSYVSFPIGHPKYTPPEVFLAKYEKGQESFSYDTWSLGIILLEVCIGKPLWEDAKLSQLIPNILQTSNFNVDIFSNLIQMYGAQNLLEDLDPKLVTMIKSALESDVRKRPTPTQLLSQLSTIPSSLPKFKCCTEGDCVCVLPEFTGPYPRHAFFESCCLSLDIPKTPLIVGDTSTNGFCNNNLFERPLKEIFYLWQLAGGDVISEVKRQGLTRRKPGILSLSNSVKLSGETTGSSKDRGLLLDNTVIILPLDELKKRLTFMSPSNYHKLLITSSNPNDLNGNKGLDEAALLPLVIREKDIEYQFNRILLFDKLLKGYPFTKDLIREECLIDIPPYLRAQTWTCLLGVCGDIEWNFNGIDKETQTSTDRQIEVDVPRCHQYDELLSSPCGHEKFKRILKAWVVSNKDYVYWQGLDSLSAPFLYLNFNNEAIAFSCLSSFIPKYLYNFFLKDNSAVIQEYLAKFSQLIAFHDPILTNHLDSIGFIPELYAIPWFLTMFSHVFPLHKIFHLWDKLLLGDSSFPLCIGLSILYQLREGLLNAGFNECILLFSDMPEINIEKCVIDSVETFSNTPRSILRRKHEPPPTPQDSTLASFKNGSAKISFQSYTSDNSSVNEALKMDPISLVELKKEKCPRISGQDLIEILSHNDSTKILLVIDVRNKEDYNRGAIPGSINIPFMTAFTVEGNISSAEDLNLLNSYRGSALFAVVGNRGESATKFAEKLLRLEFPKVCVLHKGIDIFRSGHFLVVPSTV